MISAALLSLALTAPQFASVDGRVEATLRQMTLDEKIDMVAGVDGFYIRDLPRLGLRRIKMSDGPVGIRNYGPSTAYAGGACLAATWNTDLARRFGEELGRDARARGVHVWLGPGVNLARIPQNGRNFEYFGEDPLLAGKIAAAAIRGSQSRGVVATVKHYAANNHESDRNQDDSIVDERTLRELYLKPFEIAVKEGQVAAVMCSYNRINGPYASDHDWLQNQVLKKEWGFRGILMSDWGAVHATEGPALHGMDLEMPGPAHFNRGALKPLVESGKVPEAVLDEKVRRILRVGYGMGYHDRDQEIATIPKNNPVGDAVTLQMAREGMVLLKNNGLLPLDRKKVKKIVVVGPNAEMTAVTGGGSGYTTAFKPITLLEALKDVAGPWVEVVARPFLDQGGAFNFDGYVGDGLKMEWFDNRRFEGTPTVATVRKIDNVWRDKRQFSVRWTGKFVAPDDGDTMLILRSDDGMRVSIDGKRVANMWGEHGVETQVATVPTRKGQTYDLEVEYFQADGDAVAQFGILPVNTALDSMVPAELVADADVVVASVGFNSNSEGEGHDRSFELPSMQGAALRQLVARHPKVVVVNNSGAGIDMTPFVAKAGAVLQAWYPGQNGNRAAAEILFGVVNPSGKLPTTFPRALKGTYYETAYPPIDRKIVYSEGLFMGYRWFDANQAKPLFPFGHGLSYTKFSLGKPQVERSAKNLVVRVRVSNVGARAGKETVQVYVGKPVSPVKRPVRDLRGWAKVDVAAKKSAVATVAIPIAELATYDVKAQRWVVEPGDYSVWVGTSSADLLAPVKVRI